MGSKFNWPAIQKYYDESHTIDECKAKFGFSNGSWNSAKRRGEIVPRSLEIPLDKQLTKDSLHSRFHVKNKLLKSGMLKEICNICNLAPTWNNKKLVLILDHINGVKDDYRIENLRLLCPNCNSQTDTFSGRNIGRSSKGKTAASEAVYVGSNPTLPAK